MNWLLVYAADEYIMDKWADEVKDSWGKRILKICSSNLCYKRLINKHLSPSSIIIDCGLDYVVLTKFAGQTFQGLTQAIAHKVSS